MMPMMPLPQRSTPIGRPVRCRATRAALASLVFGTLLFAGCTTGAAVPPLVPVKGKVTVDDKPLASGNVSFVPDIPDEKADTKFKFAAPTGQINANGEYELFTEGKAGAPVGKYKVMVTVMMVPEPGAKGPPKMPFNDKFRDSRTSPIVKEVTANAAPGTYDLKLTK